MTLTLLSVLDSVTYYEWLHLFFLTGQKLHLQVGVEVLFHQLASG